MHRFISFMMLSAVIASGLPIAATAQGRPTSERWALTIQGAAGLPQDVWIAATGNNTDGWLGGGSICLGLLAQGFDVGDTATLLTKVVEAGVIGVDGSPVSPGDYLAPGIDIPDRDFSVVDGQTFYAIVDFRVSESNIDLFDAGDSGQLMFTFETALGRTEQELVLWFPDGFGGFVPFLNEGLMSTNLRLR